MFKAADFIAALFFAVTYAFCLSENQPPHVIARLQAEADARAIADGLEAAKDASITICLIDGGCK